MENTLKLVEPITVEGDTVTELTLRSPKAGDYLMMERKGKGDQHKTFLLIGALSGLSETGVAELDEIDIDRIDKKINEMKLAKRKRAEELDKGK